MMPKLYFAAPLFSQAERSFNVEAAGILGADFEVFLPQRDGGLVADIQGTGISIEESRRIVFARDLDAVRASHVVLAVLDGRTIDEGVAFELGFANALGKRCIALHTDVRRLLPAGNNPMIDGALERSFASVDAIVSWARVQGWN
jgi:nucleoside 2-deoxyribosyltransferase